METQKNININYDNSTAEQREEMERFIDQNIAACQSHLVEELFKREIFSFEEIQNLFYRNEPREIYEWYLIGNSWAKEKLLKLNEPILDTVFGTWWGRTCTGQHIALDPTFWDIKYENRIDDELN